MLTEREQRLKAKLVDDLDGSRLSGAQLGGLSFAEKKHLREELDASFLRKEYEKMRSRERWITGTWILAAILITVVLALNVARSDDAFYVIFWMLEAVLGGVMTGLYFAARRRRLHNYELLLLLADEPAQPAAPAEAAPEIERTDRPARAGQNVIYETTQRR